MYTAANPEKSPRDARRVITPIHEATVVDVDDLVGWADVAAWRRSLAPHLRRWVFAAARSAGGHGIHAIGPTGLSAAHTREMSGDPLFRRLSLRRGFWSEFALGEDPVIFVDGAVALRWAELHRRIRAR